MPVVLTAMMNCRAAALSRVCMTAQRSASFFEKPVSMHAPYRAANEIAARFLRNDHPAVTAFTSA